MNFTDLYPLGVREITVFQGDAFAFVQATVMGNRVPKGEGSVDLQFWGALQESGTHSPDDRYCIACGTWRHKDKMAVHHEHLGLCIACEPNAGVMPPGFKRCKRCWKVKRLGVFSADNRQRDGRQSWCKHCNAERMYLARWHERENKSA
jgi:hypothetical protein